MDWRQLPLSMLFHILFALVGWALAQYAVSPYYGGYSNYGSTSILPYGGVYGAGYGYPSTGTAPYGAYPYYGYTGTLLGGGYGYPSGYPYTGMGTGYPSGYPYPGMGSGYPGIGTGFVGDPTGGPGGVGPITGVAPGGVVNPGGMTLVTNPAVITAGASGIMGAMGVTAITASNIVGTEIPGTFTIGDTLIVTGFTPGCCPPGLRQDDSVWSVNLLSAAQAPLVHMAVKVGWTRFTINSAINGWTGAWYPPRPAMQASPFRPNSPYTMQITNTATILSILINNLPYNYPNVARTGLNSYAALGFVGYDKGQVCSVTLVRGGVSTVIAIGASPLCQTGIVG